MKYMIMMMSCIGLFCAASAQRINERDVPASVITLYQARLLDSTISAKWERLSDYYIAHFKKNDLQAVMLISDKTEWLATMWEIPVDYVPKKVKNYVAEHYAGYKTVFTKIEYKPGSENYLVSLKKKKHRPVLRFNVKSEFVKIEPGTDIQKQKTGISKDKD